MVVVIRKHTPRVYKRYQSYKRFLREDFNYQCVYCTITEKENVSFHNFSVEHLKPKSLFPKLECHYPNLLYACNECNTLKGEDWPDESLIESGYYYLDPCIEDYDQHFILNTNNFEITPRSPAAYYMIRQIKLNRRILVELRKSRKLDDSFDQVLSSFIPKIRKILNKYDVLNKEELNDDVNELETLYHELLRGRSVRFENHDLK